MYELCGNKDGIAGNKGGVRMERCELKVGIRVKVGRFGPCSGVLFWRDWG